MNPIANMAIPTSPPMSLKAFIINPLIGLLVLGTIFFLLENVVGRAVPQRVFRRGFWLDVVYLFIAPLLKLVTRITLIVPASLLLLSGVTSLEVFRAHQYHGFGLATMQPHWLQVIEIILLADLSGYAIHRLFHTDGWWPFHAVHHSSESVDWLSAVRVHPVNELFDKIAQVTPVLLLGFDPTTTVAFVPFLTLYAIYIHANVNWDNGPLRAVLASPVFHRWHHSKEPAARNKNFAGLFPLWDILFGTYYMPKDIKPKVFGIDEILPAHYPGQFWAPFASLIGRKDDGTRSSQGQGK